MSLKIKSVTQLVDLVSSETVNFTKTPQINGVDISTGGNPAGSTTQIQYNEDSAFAGSSNLTFNGTTLTGSFTGSLAEFTTLSASNISLAGTALQPIKYYQKPIDPIGKIWAPEVYYKFDSDFSDSSGFGRTATTAGNVAPTIQTSIKKFGAGALKMSADGQIKYLVDSTTSGVSPAIPMHQYQTGWTFSTWFYATSAPNESFVIAIKWTFGGYTTNDRILFIDSSGNLQWARSGTANVQLMSNGSQPLCDSSWHHIAFTFWRDDPLDPTAIKLRSYYDGTNLGATTVTMPSWSGAVSKTFSSNGDNASSPTGKDFYLDDLMFTNYPLGPDIITEIWNGGTGKVADEAGIMT